MQRPVLYPSFVLAGWLAWAGIAVAQQPAQAKKLALLVGVNRYAHADLNKPIPLQYAEADVTALKEVLEQSDYTVTVLTGEQAKLATIRNSLATLKKNGIGAQVVLAAFAGHGIQPEDSKDAYFCPYDADKAVFERNGKKEADWDLKNTMLSLAEVLEELRACGAESKAIFVDACRNDPKTGRGPGFGTAFNVGDLPENLALLLSCSKGERAWEDKTWGHGAFFFHVLKGLTGVGAIWDRVSASSLAAYLDQAVSSEVPKVIGGGATQRPHAIINGRADLFITVLPSSKEKPASELLKTSIGMQMKLIPAGQFVMGSDDTPQSLRNAGFAIPSDYDLSDENPLHDVRITRAFFLGLFEVTKGQFAQFVQSEAYRTDAEKDGRGGWGYDSGTKSPKQNRDFSWKNTGWPQTDSHPVVNVSWNDATAFCHWLSRKEGRTYRLPTEAEWEYACKSGTISRYSSGERPGSLHGYANLRDDSFEAKFPIEDYTKLPRSKFDDGWPFTAPVGRLEPNGFGIFDMHGNVWEWCTDRYKKDYYNASPSDDPGGPSSGVERVVRGGSWFDPTRYCRSADRGRYEPSVHFSHVGFRVALTPSNPSKP